VLRLRRHESAPRGGLRLHGCWGARGTPAVLVDVVALGVRDEGDGLEVGSLKSAGDEGVGEAGTAGNAEAEGDVRVVFYGAAGHGSSVLGARADHAEFSRGGRK